MRIMHDRRRRTKGIDCMISLSRGFAIIILALVPAAAIAQEPPAEHQHAATPAASSSWTWTGDANAFIGYNYQQRLFADFSAWESQNWFMGAGERPLGNGRLLVQGMLSLEPFTIGRLVYAGGQSISAGGSPQLFQTGESYQGTPLVNYQHPHDLIMGLGATYRLERPRLTYIFGADLVGSPTLGPVPFMHRDSARDNPQVRLSHHFLDSTHITTGVLRAGVDTRGFTFETSVFRGEEPNENRLNIDRPRLDSWAARVGWRRGPWDAQMSGGRLHEPEWFEPYDVTRLTASIGFTGSLASRPAAATLAWGENREFTPFRAVADAYLLEADVRAADATSLYGRIEMARKEIFGLGYHPKGFGHPHIFSDIDAFTIGAIQGLPFVRFGRVGAGADITTYRMSADMAQYFAGSRSFHVFIRWRPRVATATHVH
jgi:hypothetical protein